MSQQIKSIFLLAAMLIGILFCETLNRIAFLSPYLIFTMLFITYCRVSIKDLRLSHLHWALLAFQTIVSVILYFIIAPFDRVLAQGVMICVFIPTANASPVIAGMLGGNVGILATYLLLCNISAAILAPIYFSFMGDVSEFSFIGTVLYIFKRVVPLIIGPFILSVIVEWISSKWYGKVKKLQRWTFYIWNITLMLVMASATSFIIKEFKNGDVNMNTFFIYVIASLVVCALQFVIGRKIGWHYKEPVVGGQGLGQKNTILAIWLVQAYLNPLACIIPAAYVFWQNLVNSIQLWLHKNRK